jgi:chromatin segregation and condensation protein Rec8/ScpA/Scc1 (kleisin family)
MAVTQSPSTEAMSAIVEQINSGTAYELSVTAAYSETLDDELEDIPDLRVDVLQEEEEQLNETLDVEDRTSHMIRVWIRKRTPTQDEIDAVKLIVRQIWQRVNNFNSSNGRVKVWECDMDRKEVPNKTILKQSGLFVASMLMRVEVEASA